MMSFTTLQILSCIVDGLIVLGCTAAVMTLGRNRGRLTVLGAIGAAALAGPILLVKAVAMLLLTQTNQFGLFHMAYIDLVIVWPAIALLLLVAGAIVHRTSRHTLLTMPVRVLAVLVMLGAPAIGVYATYIEATNLQVERAELDVAAERTIDTPIRIGILADFQTDCVGRYERRAIDTLIAERPDIIVIPGDVFQGTREQFEQQLPELRELFGRLTAPGGVYFVSGNCDSDYETNALFDRLDVRVLDNAIVQTDVNGTSITIGGVEENCTTPAARDIIARLEEVPGNEPRLLIAHRPDALFEMNDDTRIDLLIAGHTHGGQVCVPLPGPGFGPLMTLSDVPRKVAAGGLHYTNGRVVYVSRGVGLERGQAPRLRFLCPPEVSMVTMTSATQ